MKKKRMILIMTIILSVAIGVVLIMAIDNKDSKEKNSGIQEEKTTTKTTSERKRNFANNIKNKFIELGYMEVDNLKAFEVIEIMEAGHYASNPNEKHYQIKYIYECIDGGEDCISFRQYKALDDTREYEIIWILASNDKVLDIMQGVTVNFNSDYIQTDDIIE